MSETSNYLKIAGAVILPNIGGWLGSIITRANIKPWYASLAKPKFNPPNYVFAPAWTSIYAGMGYASYLVYQDLLANGNGFDRRAQMACILYANQLALNWAWTPIFFKYHSLKWVRIDIENNLFLETANRKQKKMVFSYLYSFDSSVFFNFHFIYVRLTAQLDTRRLYRVPLK